MSLRVYLVGKVYYMDIRGHGLRRSRRSLGTGDLEEARRRAAIFEGTKLKAPTQSKPIDLARRLYRLRERSKKRGHDCRLTKQDLELLFARANGRCEVTGVPFSADKQVNWDKAPFAPSIDRIDNSRPYSFANCRVVCHAVNIAINEWGMDVFLQIAQGAVRTVSGTQVPGEPHEH